MIWMCGYLLEVRSMGLRGRMVSVVPSMFLCAAATCFGQASGSGQTAGDWPMYGHDGGSTRYSPLTQVNLDNVSKLTRAWTFHMTLVAVVAVADVPGGARQRPL